MYVITALDDLTMKLANADTPEKLNYILQQGSDLVAIMANPKLQLKVLELMQSAISKYIKLRTN